MNEFKFIKPEDFDPTILYVVEGQRLCGACIRAYFGMYTDSALRESVSKPWLSGQMKCANFDIGCASQEKIDGDV